MTLNTEGARLWVRMMKWWIRYRRWRGNKQQNELTEDEANALMGMLREGED